jgi:hypothetical protein
MPLSKYPEPTAGGRKRTRQDSPPPNPTPPSRPQYLNTTPHTNAREQGNRFISGLNARERVELILYEIHEQHRWTIKDLLYHIVVEESSAYAPTRGKRRNDLSNAVLGQEAVIRSICHGVQGNKLFMLNNIMGEIYKREIGQLHTVQGLGKFDINTSPKELDIPKLATQVKDAAPSFWQFLNILVTTQHHQGQDYQPTKNFNNEFVMICAIMAHYRGPITSNSFQIMLGLHLHSMGVKRRMISLLAGLGVTLSYKSIISYVDQLATLAEVSHASIIYIKQF